VVIGYVVPVHFDVVVDHVTHPFMEIHFTFGSVLVLERCTSLRTVFHLNELFL